MQQNNIRPRPRDIVLLVSFALPVILVIATGIASAILEVQGNISSSQVLITVQYTAWGAIELVWACIVLYYGLNFALILRSHIMVTEARNNLPPKAFGLANLKSESPARYLLIMVQITVTARGILLVLAGSLSNLRAWSGEDFLGAENEILSHVVAVMWTCPITIIHLVQLILIALHCRRTRAAIAHDLVANGSPKHGTVDGQNSLGKLTLHLQTNSSWSQTSNTLERVLFELAKAPFAGDDLRELSIRPGDDLYEPSIRPGGDAQSEMGEEDEDLKNRTLKSKQRRQRKPVETEQFRTLQHHLQDVQQSLEQLQNFYEQLQPLPALQTQGEESVRLDPVESMRALHLRSSMSILQRHLKFTLRQLNYQIESCQSNLAS
ncbi:hypothetical protein BGZ72_002906 [Mortierella alpina]|nr:hypothetical protein BGZ72_002906 [Mortierella alpina]